MTRLQLRDLYAYNPIRRKQRSGISQDQRSQKKARRDRTIEEQKEVSKTQYKEKMALFQAEYTRVTNLKHIIGRHNEEEMNGILGEDEEVQDLSYHDCLHLSNQVQAVALYLRVAMRSWEAFCGSGYQLDRKPTTKAVAEVAAAEMTDSDSIIIGDSIAGSTVVAYYNYWRKHDYKCKRSMQGKAETKFIINQEHWRKCALEWIGINADPRGKPNMTARSFVHFVNTEMMPKFVDSATDAEKQMLKRYRNVNNGVVSYVITERVGTRWLLELGCKSVPYKKGLYYWGATKPDVIEEKNAFVMEYCRAELQLPVWKGVPLKITSRGVVDVGYEQEGPRSEGKWLDCNGREWGVGGVPGSRIWRLALARWPLN